MSIETPTPSEGNMSTILWTAGALALVAVFAFFVV